MTQLFVLIEIIVVMCVCEDIDPLDTHKIVTQIRNIKSFYFYKKASANEKLFKKTEFII